jgi:protocatechuate 3,4-dioxygenase beta subunit
MSYDSAGTPLLVLCTVKDSHGKLIPNVKIDIWETDSKGHYDVQYPDREGPDGRCIMRSDEEGNFWFKAIKPVSYPIPHDGPVGKLLEKLHRHPYRPAHMHFMFEKPGYDHLITALYLRGDPYETTDAVFGVKSSLVVDLDPLPQTLATEYSLPSRSLLLTYDFVLVTEKEASDLRDEKSRKTLKELGRKIRIVEGLPVPDVD